MKRNRIVALLIVVMMLMLALAGCGQAKPTADDAKAYVQATLDLLCTGDYDHSIDLADVAEGEEEAVREEMFAGVKEELMSSANISDETADVFQEFMFKCFGLAKYEVMDAVETEDGGFDVTVSVEPLKAYAGADEFIDELTFEDVGVTAEEFLALTADEQQDIVLRALFNFLIGKLDTPTYGDPTEVVLHYELLDEENNMYGCDEEQGELFATTAFSFD
ncbi:MAG: hypothetical protein K6D56_01195 [Clostridia bacterium]|nr:hypothetical protein [Clostridia bacterium]